MFLQACSQHPDKWFRSEIRFRALGISGYLRHLPSHGPTHRQTYTYFKKQKKQAFKEDNNKAKPTIVKPVKVISCFLSFLFGALVFLFESF